MCSGAEVDDGPVRQGLVLFKSYDASQARCLQVDRTLPEAPSFLKIEIL